MICSEVINHIQKILNKCGDPVILTPKGKPEFSPDIEGHYIVEINKVEIMRQNKCCLIPTPKQLCSDIPSDKYWVNRIYIPKSFADDYLINDRLSDDAMKNHICNTKSLFACYD